MRIFLVLSLFWSSLAFSCTDFVVQAKDGTLVNGRTLEFAQELQSTFKVFVRGQRMFSQNPQKKKGVEWVTKYGFLGITCFGTNICFDGLNEAGLSFGALWLPGVTQYQTVDPKQMKMALDFADFGTWVMSSFSTVDQVKEALKEVRIWGHPIPPLKGIPPLHVAIHDARGNNIVVELIGGEMKVYDNPISVLTNSPPFDWQLANLQNYLFLDAMNVEPIEFRGVSLKPPGQGSGLAGIPGDWTPPSRFVKMFTYLRFAKPVMNAKEGVNLVEHLLNTVDIPQGEVQQKGQDNGDYTQWAVIKDLTHRIFYFRSYKDTTLKMVDLNKLDFDTASGKTLSLETGSGYVDMTNSLKTKESMTALK